MRYRYCGLKPKCFKSFLVSGFSNFPIYRYLRKVLLQTQIPDESLAGIQIFFPDPWPKKRHHKRRLIQTEFVHLLTLKLKKSGFIHCATDWQEYAVHMLEVLSTNRSLKNLSPQEDGYIPRPETRPLTKFEQRGTRLGHGVWDLLFIKEEQHD